MKPLFVTGLIFSWVLCISLNAQQPFDPGEYMQYLEQHQDLSAAGLQQLYPAKTTYYSGRLHPTPVRDIPWFDTIDQHLQLTTGELELLSSNHFMISERLRYPSWAQAFISIYSRDLPLFISTDFILSTLHISYDNILQTVEWQYLEPNLLELLHAMYDYYPVLQAEYVNDTAFHFPLRDVDLFLSVALSLAEGEEYPPRIAGTDSYNQVMDAIDAEQMTSLPLFTYGRTRKIDFSQFTPRGHYDEDIYTGDGIIRLDRYFKAMMWLGRIDFLLTAPPDNPWENDWSDQELRRMQMGAVLLNEILYHCGHLANLQNHEAIISFLAGPDDNLTPAELKGLTDRLLSGPGDLTNPDTFREFSDSLNASDDFGQKIMSNFFFVDPHSSDPGKLPVSFKLLGQKFLIDSYIFSEVVFDRILFEGRKVWRALPDPLDVMAALGNEDAVALLEPGMNTYHYASNMAGLMYLINAYDDSFWEQSLYNTWLDAIRSLNPPASSTGIPYFMQTTAWHQEKLNTQLTSWAQLRHDNILYGKQSYTGGTGCSFPLTWIEPYPEFYRIIMQFAAKASSFFAQQLPGDMPDREQIIGYYDRFGQHMEQFEHIAVKERAGSPLGETEITYLKTMINAYMASGPSITGWYNELFFDLSEAITDDFTVADVHTQPTDQGGNVVGRVLHAGNGFVNLGVFIAPDPCDPEHLMAFTGPVGSFHSTVTGDFERLNDDDWRSLFMDFPAQIPERPDWTSSYLADSYGMVQSGGRALEGIVYDGAGIDPAPRNAAGYFLVFPNPARTEAHLRFLLNREATCSLEIFDAAGRRCMIYHEKELTAGEHDLAIPVSEWSKGMYLARILLNGEALTRVLIVD